MDNFHKLVELFRSFPGIGPRQAERFVFFLLAREKPFLDDLQRLIAALKKEIGQCPSCLRYFQKRAENSRCALCSSKNRDEKTLMVVAHDVDLEAVEKSGAFLGKYVVLGGTVPILEKAPQKSARIRELARIVSERAPRLREIILAFNFTPEGEHTIEYVMRLLKPRAEAHKIKISLLGRGLSTGSELEYADPETLKSALQNRRW